MFFRVLGLALIINEVAGRGQADWHVLVAGFGAFFMPDWLRGKSSPFVRAVLKTWTDSASSKAADVAEELEKVSDEQDGA